VHHQFFLKYTLASRYFSTAKRIEYMAGTGTELDPCSDRYQFCDLFENIYGETCRARASAAAGPPTPPPATRIGKEAREPTLSITLVHALQPDYTLCMF